MKQHQRFDVASFYRKDMKVCILYCPAKKTSVNTLKILSESFAKGISENSHEVFVFDIKTEHDLKISIYDYILFLTDSPSFWGGKIDSAISSFLQSCGVISGKKSSCFLYGTCLRKQKTLSLLMTKMEEQGLFLRLSDFIKNKDQAYALGMRLKI